MLDILQMEELKSGAKKKMDSVGIIHYTLIPV